MTKRTNDTELHAMIDTFVAELAAGVDAVRCSEQFTRWLDTFSAFHTYSVGNVILILSHKPEATRVAGYRAWAKLGRNVRRGERGIPILAPVFKRADEGEAEASEGANRALYFRTVYVFDVSQTEGEPLPEIQARSTAQDDALRARLMAFAQTRGITVSVQALAGETQGMSFGGHVALVPSASVKTLVHELAHELMHQAGQRPTPEVRELEAEAVAYVVCRWAGLRDGLACPTYIAVWNGDSDALRGSLRVIQATAATLITAIADDAGEAPATE